MKCHSEFHMVKMNKKSYRRVIESLCCTGLGVSWLLAWDMLSVLGIWEWPFTESCSAISLFCCLTMFYHEVISSIIGNC